MELDRIKELAHKKLKSSKTTFRQAVPIACAAHYSVKSFGLHLKAFFLGLFQSKNSMHPPACKDPRISHGALSPLSESGGARLPLLLLIVATFLSLPLFFGLGNADAGRGDGVQMEATQYSNTKEVIAIIKDDNIMPPRIGSTSLGNVPAATERPMVRQALQTIPPDFKRGSTELKEVSFTFDGGSHRGQTRQILNTLRQRGIKTTIFLTGLFMKQNPMLVRRMVADGHEIGNHSMNHPHMTTYSKNGRQRTHPQVSRSFVVSELRQASDIFTRITGRKMSPLWRAPYGEINKEIRGWAYNAGYVHVGWTADYTRRESLDSLDWVSETDSRLFRTTDQIKQRILGFGKGHMELRGGIALMHLGTWRRGEKLADRLGEIIDELQVRGYRFVKASTLIKGRKDMAAYLIGTDHFAMAETNLTRLQKTN